MTEPIGNTELTREQVLTVEPGRELDAIVAEKVFGWYYGTYHPELLRYSTDISVAWEVVEKMDANKWDMKLIKSGQYNEVSFGNHTVIRVNVPEAICKASLLAVMGL